MNPAVSEDITAEARLRFTDVSRRLTHAGSDLVGDRMDRLRAAQARLEAVAGDLGRGDLDADESNADALNADDFARRAIRVICGVGVAPSLARRAYERCCRAIEAGATVRIGFRHPAKADAIDRIWRERDRLHGAFLAANDKLGFIGALPWIGEVTKRRLARDLGLAPSETAFAGAPPAQRGGRPAHPTARPRSAAQSGRPARRGGAARL